MTDDDTTKEKRQEKKDAPASLGTRRPRPDVEPSVAPFGGQTEPGGLNAHGNVGTGTDDELARCRAERDEYLDGWKRAKAELQNYKKDEAERLERFAKFATEDLVRDLLSVMDSFDFGVKAMDDDRAAMKGFMLIRSQLESVLSRRGLERLLAPPGTPFDPARHEAVGEAVGPPAGAGPPGSVLEEVCAGFLLQGKVLRPARVILVAKERKSAVEDEKQP